jgi:hypothetical protein
MPRIATAKAAFLMATTCCTGQQIPRLKSKSISTSLLLGRINGPYGPDKKKPGAKPGEVKVRQIRQNLPEGTAIRQRREEESDAALKSAAADIGGIAPLCNAACLMKGLR